MPFFDSKFAVKHTPSRKYQFASTLHQNLDPVTHQREFGLNYDSVKLKLGKQETIFKDGKWVSVNGTSTNVEETSIKKELNHLSQENQSLIEENNMLKVKVELLLTMLAETTAETHMQEAEIIQLKEKLEAQQGMNHNVKELSVSHKGCSKKVKSTSKVDFLKGSSLKTDESKKAYCSESLKSKKLKNTFEIISANNNNNAKLIEKQKELLKHHGSSKQSITNQEKLPQIQKLEELESGDGKDIFHSASSQTIKDKTLHFKSVENYDDDNLDECIEKEIERMVAGNDEDNFFRM